jgi:hypothetical protein
MFSSVKGCGAGIGSEIGTNVSVPDGPEPPVTPRTVVPDGIIDGGGSLSESMISVEPLGQLPEEVVFVKVTFPVVLLAVAFKHTLMANEVDGVARATAAHAKAIVVFFVSNFM